MVIATATRLRDSLSWRGCWPAALIVLCCSCQAPFGNHGELAQRTVVPDAPIGQLAASQRPTTAPQAPIRQVAAEETANGPQLASSAPPSPAPVAGSPCCGGAPCAHPMGDASMGWPPTMGLPPVMGMPTGPPPSAANEYVCDGGDQGAQAYVRRDWTVRGLQLEDTIAHYDTVDGRTEVEASNRVCIYAPRFAAVRQVSGVVQHEQSEQLVGVESPVSPAAQGSSELVTTVIQPVEPRGQRAVKFGQSFRERQRTVGAENLQALAVTEKTRMPYEDFQIIERGQFDNSEKARLANRLQAAVTWSADQAVQVVIDNVTAAEATGTSQPQGIYTYEMPEGKPRLRIVKVASRNEAHSGDVIHFTIRFDNIGDQVIGNVTIIDNLSRRLEYVESSQECSIDADFLPGPNSGESLTLRWEIRDPLKVGEGGVIRFQCRVR